MSLRHVEATRYLAALREGGSLPGLLEADDDGIYVTKFRGAGQGPKALVAEVVAGELGRRLFAGIAGVGVPDLVVVDLDPGLSRLEPDEEVQDLLKASPGENLGMDYLPGSFGFDPSVSEVSPFDASCVLWFDALIQNVDRSWRNPNLLTWGGRLFAIDHGASLYWQHAPRTAADVVTRPYPAADHVLIGRSGPVSAADERLAPLVTRDILDEVVSLVPASWLPDDVPYTDLLLARLEARGSWLPALETVRAEA